MRSRTITALAGLAISLLASALVWYWLETLLLFLVVPFVPFLLSRRDDAQATKRCPRCGFRTRDTGYEYCPRDGEPLENG